jgi:hypothetical protein
MSSDGCPLASNALSAADIAARFLTLAPFLRAADWPTQRMELSRGFDSRIARHLAAEGAALPQIHCFYEVLSETAQHQSLITATASMRRAGHPVCVWSYSPERLDFLLSHGVELRSGDDLIPRGLYEQIVAGSEIRYFSDIFRYAALYEHGGLWMDTDVVLLRPFPFKGEHFFNLQWRGGHAGHFVCGNVMYARPRSRHIEALYGLSMRIFESGKTAFGDIGPRLLSHYIASDAGAELCAWVFSPVLFNSIDWTETALFSRPPSDVSVLLSDDRVFGIHLWNYKTQSVTRDSDTSLIGLLSRPDANLASAVLLK